MADPQLSRDTGTPRWVKVSGLIVLALVAVFIILKLTGVGGDHGPGRHSQSAHVADARE